MKPILSVMALSVLAACGGSGTNSSAPDITSSMPTPVAPDTVENNSFAGLLNNVRIANSAAPVAFDARLGEAAQTHASDMLAQNYFSHTGKNGSSPGDRITAAGYNWRTYGENIAQGQTSQAEVLAAWTNSPGHHANNINPNFEDFGLGKAGAGSSTRWVLVLAAE